VLSQTWIFEFSRLLLLLFFLLLFLLSKIVVSFSSHSSDSHLIILTAILIVVIVHSLAIFHVIAFRIEPLILLIVVGRGILHHTVHGSVAGVGPRWSLHLLFDLILDFPLFLVELRRLISLYLTH